MALAAAAAVSVAAFQGAPVAAQSHEVISTPVFPGLEHQQIRVPLDDGRAAIANVLAFKASDANLRLRPVLGQGRVPGLETVPGMGKRELPRGAVAGINGGFWLRSPVGDPNSFLALDGKLVSEAETQGAGPRGTFARRADGSVVMDRLDTTVSLRIAGITGTHLVTALNRFHRASPPYPDDTVRPVYVYTSHFGATVKVQPITVDGAPLPVLALVAEGLEPRPSGTASGQVGRLAPAPGEITIPAGGSVIVAHGAAATDLAAAVPGAQVDIDVELHPADSTPQEWELAVDALAAGPLIVRKHERVDPSGWENEGFAPNTHSNVRHPRSAMAVTGDGRVLLVTVDGRQPGYSAGMTMHELSHFLRTLGVRDGLSLDGGASSQFVIDGTLRNRPCCDASLRPVATGLFVYHAYPFERTTRIAGSGREATAAAVALAAYPEGTEEVLIAAAANFPDALAGGPLAHARQAPLLLSGRDDLPPATLDALAKLQPERVTILGGTGAVGQAVEDRLQTRYTVRRLSGAGRVETAVAIADALGETHERVFLADAGSFPDALSAAAPGGLLGMPILLTGPEALAAPVEQFLDDADAREVVIVGGPRAVGEDVAEELAELGYTVTRLAGASRFGTAAAVNRWAAARLPRLRDNGLVVAAAASFADALAGGPLAASRRQLLMIAPTQDIYGNPESKAYFDELARGDLLETTLIGGHAALSSYVQWQLDQLPGG
jgi:putative cell wall-binding protein